NMFWLIQLGTLVERRSGTKFLILLVLVIAAGSDLAQALLKGPSFGGMSGVLYGLLAYCWIRGKLDFLSGYFIDRQTMIYMILWLVVCGTGLVGPVANGAHLGGLIIGAAWGAFDAQFRRGSDT